MFIARFVTGLRVFCAVLAGGSGLQWRTFLFYNAAGAIVWSTTIAAVGYSLAYSWDTLERWIGRSGGFALALVVDHRRGCVPAKASNRSVMNTLAPGISYIDLQFLGMPQVIATGVVHGPGGVALVDPGPSSSLASLTASLESAGMSWRDVTTLLITHIHLDHSGACGTLVRDHPALRIYVHEKGAPHLVNPDKLLGERDAVVRRRHGEALG